MLQQRAVRTSQGSSNGDTCVLPIGGHPSLALDTDVLRQRLGAWIATQAASERPSVDVLWREATLVCDGIVALACATFGAGNAPLWLVDVRVSPDAQELVHWTGLSSRTVFHTVEALVAAEVLDGVSQVGRERVVRIRPDLLLDAPVLAAVDWRTVRHRLGEAASPIAHLLVRELARRTTIEARLQGHFISVSQRELAEAVGYSKASMRRHLDVLAAAGVIVSRSRDRANSWHRLQALVFGAEGGDTVNGRRTGTDAGAPIAKRDGDRREDVPGPTPTSARNESQPMTGRAGFRAGRAERAAAARPVISRASAAAARDEHDTSGLTSPTTPAQLVESALTFEVNGVSIALPSGVELTLEQDASGALWYRAGALRFGPVRFS